MAQAGAVESSLWHNAAIAGGIGITPFRSMLRFLHDREESRDVVVLYGAAEAADLAYRDVLDAARRDLGIRTVYAVETMHKATEGLVPGVIDAKLISREIPDFRERVFYLSGPHAMVSALSHTLRAMGLPRHRIRKDFFLGLA